MVHARPVQIGYYGDSEIMGLQYENGVYKVTNNNPPVILNKLLKKYFGEKVIARSDARIGATLGDLIDGKGYFSKPLVKTIKDNPAKFIIEDFAINDSSKYSVLEYEKYLNDFISIIRNEKKIPVLEEPNPICSTYYPDWNKNLDKFVKIINKVAIERNVILIKQYERIKSISNWKELLGDCVHPKDDYLYEIKTIAELETLRPILDKMLA